MLSKKIFKSLAGCLTLFLMIYAGWIEPNWIEITRHSLELKASRPFKIVHLSDLHISSIRYRERRTLQILEQENPDVILISGDSIAEDGSFKSVNEFLEKLSAPLGVWLVNGNWEHWRPKNQKFISNSKVRFLNNSAERLFEGLWIVGIDDALAGNPDTKKAVKRVPKGVVTFGLFHSPIFFDESDINFDLVFSGHTHGGQVRLPLLPPLWLPEGSGRFVSGWYEKNKSKMYVSRGLGNSIFNIRFLCRPEISIFDVRVR